jgi:hypothetical protein
VPVVLAAPVEGRPEGRGSVGRHHRSRAAGRGRSAQGAGRGGSGRAGAPGRRPAPRNNP